MLKFVKSVLEPNRINIKLDGQLKGYITENAIYLNMSAKEGEMFLTKDIIKEIKKYHKLSFPDGKITQVFTTK